MLVELTLIPRQASRYDPPTRVVGLNPESITRAEADSVPGYDGPATRLELDEGQIVFVTESVAEVIAASRQSAETILLVEAPGGLETA